MPHPAPLSSCLFLFCWWQFNQVGLLGPLQWQLAGKSISSCSGHRPLPPLLSLAFREEFSFSAICTSLSASLKPSVGKWEKSILQVDITENAFLLREIPYNLFVGLFVLFMNHESILFNIDLKKKLKYVFHFINYLQFLRLFFGLELLIFWKAILAWLQFVMQYSAI